MSNEERIVEELVKNALFRMDESTRMIRKSLTEISEQELWLKPNASLNSIANLILHLCGNMTQYIIASLGESEDVRNRDMEFSSHATGNKAQILEQLERTVDEVRRIIFDADVKQLVKVRSVQGFSFSGVGVIMHAVEHYSYHTGQIAFWVKLLKNKDLGFYSGTDLNIKNQL
ncbi:DUF1572 domain-containing protein [Aggregatimonas sangjinii]|uniref:DUF1572 domain-containing protein n=1 Tax=Aggregatimonas sangjinii TaxID=2583587 RepID=A0A5B7SS28_9FLAO|nr:DinB family protein [Aggregatimonas sangjinii]QCW99820.1 DUF1572 domain-containing protein [Aggregatimonas sangjinii]